MIRSNFEIPDRKEVDEIVEKIGVLQDTLRSAEKGVPGFWNDYPEFQYQKYLLECISSECNHKLKADDVKEILKGDLQKLDNLDCDVEVLKKTLRNLLEKLKNMFPEINTFSSSVTDLDVNFVKNLHREIVQGIIHNAGEFREKDAKPAEEDYSYLTPHLIEEKLQQLLRECGQTFSNPELKLLDAAKCGACFMERFLYIHPFSDGNGRTARLLLSHLLARFTIVPLSLYTSREGRGDYLDCIRQARYGDVILPVHLTKFILKAIQREYVDMGIEDYVIEKIN